MRKKHLQKKIIFYSLFSILKLTRGLFYCSKGLTKLIYNKIDWKDYRKKISKVDPKAEKWAKYNNWFGEDIYMTDAAFKIHRELVELEGIDPKSKKYYNEIDKRIYDQFKERIKKYYSMDN
jgi:hypothetical protein